MRLSIEKKQIYLYPKKIKSRIKMELTLNLEYTQIINLIRQLPENQIEKIKKDLTKDFISARTKSETSDFQKFILAGPVMSDMQYQDFKQQRQEFNLWRTQ